MYISPAYETRSSFFLDLLFVIGHMVKGPYLGVLERLLLQNHLEWISMGERDSSVFREKMGPPGGLEHLPVSGMLERFLIKKLYPFKICGAVTHIRIHGVVTHA